MTHLPRPVSESPRTVRLSPDLADWTMILVLQGAIEFGTVVRGIGASLGAGGVNLPQIRRRRVPAFLEPGLELRPGGAQGFVTAAVRGTGHLGGGKFALLHAARWPHVRRDRDPDLEIEYAGVHPK